MAWKLCAIVVVIGNVVVIVVEISGRDPRLSPIGRSQYICGVCQMTCWLGFSQSGMFNAISVFGNMLFTAACGAKLGVV